MRTVQAFESGEKIPHANSIAAMRRAIVDAGLALLFDDEGNAIGVGVSVQHGPR